MMKNQFITKTITPLLFSYFVVTCSALASHHSNAPGGLDKVNTFVENILNVLQGISVAVVTISIIWAGYKFLFKHADITECGKILAGGLLIGGAAELANYLLG